MRLLNCQKFLSGESDALEEFFHRKPRSNLQYWATGEDLVPCYYILSHCWGNDEVSYTDFIEGRKKDGAGYHKISGYCRFALARYEQYAAEISWFTRCVPVCYVWIDTCCIDKRSSAELSEAINSMWSYYSGALECHAYFDDVAHSEEFSKRLLLREVQPGNMVEEPMSEIMRVDEELMVWIKSRWFTRGWTLQELLASSVVLFMTSDWAVLGRKCVSWANSRCPSHVYRNFVSITDILQTLTGIERQFFDDPSKIRQASIAKRMSWASERSTTRIEDEAYCLLGILNVNLPLLYGEGTRAFRRLQAALLSASTDHSLFVWKRTRTDYNVQSGLLAHSPLKFKTSGDVKVRVQEGGTWPYAITNLGVKLRLKAKQLELSRLSKEAMTALHGIDLDPDNNAEAYVVELNAYRNVWEEDDSKTRVAENMVLWSQSHVSPQLWRVMCDDLLEGTIKKVKLEGSEDWEVKKFYVKPYDGW